MSYWAAILGKIFLFALLSATGLIVGGIIYLVLLDGPSMPWWLPFAWMHGSAVMTLAVSWNLMLDKQGRFRY